MARKTWLSLENLAALGAEKLAQLILDEAKANTPFRKKANADLAGSKGAEAVAALIDRRLSALEKARAIVAWEKEKDFAADLAATVETIVKDLGQADAAAAVERLLRFACASAYGETIQALLHRSLGAARHCRRRRLRPRLPRHRRELQARGDPAPGGCAARCGLVRAAPGDGG
jgi:hypothetical protein